MIKESTPSSLITKTSYNVVDGKPLFIKEWFVKGIHTIQQLFHENSQYLTFQEFQAKYHCNTNFLQFYLNPCAFEEQSASPRVQFELQLRRKLEILNFFNE